MAGRKSSTASDSFEEAESPRPARSRLEGIKPSTQENKEVPGPEYINNILAKSTSTKLELISKNARNEQVSPEQTKQFFEKLSKSFDIPAEKAFAATALLFLKGASNKGAPPTMGVDIITEDNNATTINKSDLLWACQSVLGHSFIRRLAEALALQISFFAEKHNLNGDLALTLNNRVIAEGQQPLTSKEKAWANSFCQSLPGLDTYAGQRIPMLLAQDYSTRFLNKQKKPKGKTKGPSRPTKSKKKQDKNPPKE